MLRLSRTRIWLLSSAVSSLGGSFTPLSLFSAGEQGYWLDPSDFSTMFQDTAGATPVTAVGQSVGLVLDKSKGLVLGPERIANGDFSNGSTGWTVPTGVSITGGWAVFATVSGNAFLSQAASPFLTFGVTYEIQFTLVSLTSGQIRARFSNGVATVLSPTVINPGTYKFYLTAASNATMGVESVGATSAVVGNISVRELPGNHAYQSSTSNAPILGRNPIVGTRNLSTYSQDFSNVVWNADGTTKASGVAGAPDGTSSVGTFTFAGTSNNYPRNTEINLVSGQTYTISAWVAVTGSVSVVFAYFNGTAWVLSSALAATSSLQRFSWTVTAAGTPSLGTGFRFSYSGSGGTVSVWGFQVELGATMTAYQKVGASFDVTEAGVQDCYYLAFDGTDDWLQSGTITPGTDKAQVFAGVRKLSDAASGMLAELSASFGSNSGVFAVQAPGGAFPEYSWNSKGTLGSAAASPSTYVAPTTNVLTCIGDIAADTCILRVNGTQAASNVTDQGTGNYLAYPLYIGRRGGTTLPFNGRIYQLITRFGPNLTAAQIQQVEAFVNQRTGAY